MGKSTTAAMFRDLGVPVWDADAAVHRLYGPEGAAVAPLRAVRPLAVGPDGVDRAALSDWIAEDPDALSRIERIVHPLVARDRAAFVSDTQAAMVVLDIPLLFETGGENAVDLTVVVSAPPEVQRTRVLARNGMTDARFDAILARQMPDAEKRARADVVVPTVSMAETRAHVERLIEDLRNRHA
ncbi:dephospho-CoA kinase [Palleronia rufa]|uniref:dephospho-CoA kinase n=1 Tax=Palleronia rufa TaxID=1530186 RepID=UPI00068D8774